MKHYLNGQEVTPRNRDSIGVVSLYTGDPNQLALNVDTIILAREGFDIVKNHIQNNGLFIAIPYTVVLEGNLTLDYYVDLTNKVMIRNNEVELKIKRKKGLDDFNEKAIGTSFEYMAKQGVNFNYHVMPYLVIKDNVTEVGLSLAISTFLMGKELVVATQQLIEAVNDLIVAATPLPGVSLAGPTLTVNTGAIVQASLNVVLRLAYVAALMIIIINLCNQILELLFPPKRYLKGLYFKEMMTKGCQFLGYNFQSSILDNFFCLPVPLQDDNLSIFENTFPTLVAPFNKGYPTASDTVGLFGDFINELKKMFNAEIFIEGNLVRLERRDYQNPTTIQTVIPSLNIQDKRDDEYTFNTEEAWKRYYIKYALDFNDVHILEGEMYKIHDAEYSTENSVTVTDPTLVMIKGLNEVSINFALGAQKETLNLIESIAYGFFVVVDFLTEVFTLGFAGTNFAQQVSNRKDALKISQQYFGITKCLYVRNAGTKYVDGVQYPQVLFNANFKTLQSAEKLWDDFHYINAIDKNDYLIKENVRIRIRPNDFIPLLNSNLVYINNKLCELLKIEWIDEKSNAKITYKEPFDYADGKVNIIRIDD